MTRVIVTGDRNWHCADLAGQVIDRLQTRYGKSLVLIHGEARGVDLSFSLVAEFRGIEAEPYPADWKTHGKAAGPIRNQEMVNAGADFVLAVHRDLAGSKGTRDCVRRALTAGIPVWLIDSEDAEPRRVREV